MNATKETRDLARAQQEAEARAGGRPRSIDEILRNVRPRAEVVDLTRRQLRRRGPYGQAALLTDQEALNETDPGRVNQARVASGLLKSLSDEPLTREFNLFGGNLAMGDEYFDAVFQRLKTSGISRSEQGTAFMTLGLITRHLEWQSYACGKYAFELAKMMDMDQPHMARTLKLLERIGAITRIKRGAFNTICITPEGVYRGDINKHADAVARYHKEVVVPLRSREPAPVA